MTSKECLELREEREEGRAFHAARLRCTKVLWRVRKWPEKQASGVPETGTTVRRPEFLGEEPGFGPGHEVLTHQRAILSRLWDMCTWNSGNA